MDMWQLLERNGIEKKEIIVCIMEMYVPHPGIETREKAESYLGNLLDKTLKDPNVNALIVAGLELEKKAGEGAIPGIDKESFRNDAVFIVSDEILGMGIAQYIGGTRALFEFVRFDREKPGILARLGPFIDDVIGALAAGVSSRMYTDAEEKLV